MRTAAIVHLELLEDLRLGEVRRLVAAGWNFMPRPPASRSARARLVVAHLAHRGVERGLAEALLEDARRVQQVVGDDRVEHPHAAFVEHAEDGLSRRELLAEAGAERARQLGSADGSVVEGAGVGGVVVELPVRSHWRSASRAKSSVKSSLQIEL